MIYSLIASCRGHADSKIDGWEHISRFYGFNAPTETTGFGDAGTSNPERLTASSFGGQKKWQLLVYTIASESRFTFIHWFCLQLTVRPWESHLISLCLRICIKIIIIADVLWEKDCSHINHHSKMPFPNPSLGKKKFYRGAEFQDLIKAFPSISMCWTNSQYTLCYIEIRMWNYELFPKSPSLFQWQLLVVVMNCI